MRRGIAVIALAIALGLAGNARAEVSELKVPLGAGGFGFLPLHMMQKYQLVEKHAAAAGLKLTVNWANIGGPAVMNEALLSGSADFISAGPPSFLTLWDRSKGAVKGAAAMSTMPMYLNTRTDYLKSVDDLREGDKIALTAVKVSIPSIVMQMYARAKYGPAETFRFDPYTVSMTHPDAAIAILSGNEAIKAHYASQPFHQRERHDPAVRTIMNTNSVMGGDTTFTMISTTVKFHDANPKAYAAFVAALKEAMQMIKADKRNAAQVLLEALGGKGYSVDELVAMLDDPEVQYTTVPQNVMKYATFMHDIGTLKLQPASLSDLFFPEADIAKGN
ncbi:MAG TPA: ABC transporter substrate-binding protein [Pseudolabrys sp.]|nr:ABC transporter substrate-binding protein [Pseudolabrys sp.]